MQDPGPSYSANKGYLAPRYESTRPLTSGHNTADRREQCMVENLQSDSQSERSRIVRAVGLEDSDEEEANGTL